MAVFPLFFVQFIPLRGLNVYINSVIMPTRGIADIYSYPLVFFKKNMTVQNAGPAFNKTFRKSVRYLLYIFIASGVGCADSFYFKGLVNLYIQDFNL